MSDPQKRRAAETAVAMVSDGMRLGLGTGSTASHFLRMLGERVRGERLALTGVATSRATEALAHEAGIPLVELDGRHLDLYVDGADEIDPRGIMIKGGGGALVREKLVAAQSARRVIVVDAAKPVARLGIGFALPVAVVPFGVHAAKARIESLFDCRAAIRERDGRPFVSDDGFNILDVKFANGIADPRLADLQIQSIPGVAETGLFLDLCDTLIVGLDGGVDVFRFRR